MSISEIEERIHERVERLWDMAPASLNTPEAWATWKRRCVSEVAIIVADELNGVVGPDCPNGHGPMTGANQEFGTHACANCGYGVQS